jgi:arginyl-tRNA synthetase
MPTVVSQLDSRFRAAIRDALGADADPLIGPAQNEAFGDYQSNAAMSLAKARKANPRAVADQIVARLDLGDLTDCKPTVAGPGFINVKLSDAYVGRRLAEMSRDAHLGVEPDPMPITVVVDYSAPNVAKQMHVGHLRSTIIGDCFCRVLEFRGHHVIRQNHIGDWGTQFGMLIAHLRHHPPGDSAGGIADLDRFYKEARQRFDSDPAFADEARAAVVRLQGGEEAENRLWKQLVDESRKHFEGVYSKLGILLTRADESGESSYNADLPQVVNDLSKAGIAVQSQGATAIFTDGVDAPLIIEKTGGGYGYATTDLAAIRRRVRTMHAQRIIYVVGSTQSQHFSQVFAAARKAGWAENVLLEHASFGSVLGEDGKMFKARSGESVKLADLLEEAQQRGQDLARAKASEREITLPEDQLRAIGHAVGIGAIKYADLSKDRLGDYVFSWDSMLAMDGNTAPYLQYAYARIRSIFRKGAAEPKSAEISPIAASPAINAIALASSQEQSLGKHVLRFGEVIEIVARDLKPHQLCTYLYALAQKFSAFYEHCPVLQSEEPTRTSRLALCDITARTLANGLDLLGIEHPEQM